MCRTQGRRCNGKCSNPVYKAAYQRARTAAIKAGQQTDEITEYLPVTLHPHGDIETQELAGVLGRALQAEGEEREWLLAFYGTEEQAVQALGRRVAARAEELAGITAEEARVDWRRRCDAACEVAEDLFVADAPQADQDRANDVFNAVYTGSDPQSKEALARLANGYRQALAEVRPMGGILGVDEVGDDLARELFGDAAEVYPSDWLKSSNAFGNAPAVFTTDGGVASYYRENVIELTGESPTREEYYAQARPGTLISNAHVSYEPMELPPPGEGPADEGYVWFRETHWEVNNGKRGRPESYPWIRPEGEGWEFHEPASVWRRPQVTYPTVTLPTLTVTPHFPSGVAGKPGGYPIAVHELAHRFEHVMVDVVRLESAFITRRTTSDRGRDPLETWNAKAPDVLVRKDHFVDAYIGREYPRVRDHRASSPESARLGNDQHFGTGYEVLSVGTESLFGGSYGGMAGIGQWRPDEDHRAFVLGTMASAGWTEQPHSSTWADEPLASITYS